MAEKEKGGRAFELKRAARDGGGEERTERGEDRRRISNSRGTAEFDPLPEHLRRKYYVLDSGAEEIKIYADRSGEYLVAKAGRDRLVTRVASIEIVRDLVAIAAHRGWERIELTGALEFRREAWLATSVRGIEAKGYEPTELDRAALAKFGIDSSEPTRRLPLRVTEPAQSRRKCGARHRSQRGGIAPLETTAGTRAPTSPSLSGWFSPPSPRIQRRANAFSTPRASAWRITTVGARASIGRKSSSEKGRRAKRLSRRSNDRRRLPAPSGSAAIVDVHVQS